MSKSEYSQVPKDEEEQVVVVTKKKSIFSIANVVLVLVCLLAGSLGYFGAQSVAKHIERQKAPPVDTIMHTFSYNRSFSYPPSNETNRAWRQIFPKEGGFFVHPTIAPTRSTFSVFHQLHCLNGLRGAYFANLHAAQAGKTLLDEDLPVDLQMSHMRHCIDLLRQVLMCHADMTLEVVDEKINGVHGFRTPHVCKNWDQLKDWTSAQQEIQHVEQIV